MREFDLQSLPLDRNALIEASAGTGKTFTIVNLVLRYLLEPIALEPIALEPFGKQGWLTIDRILVVTFTRAAVDELRGRIRQRIEQAVKAITADAGIDSCSDPTLRDVLRPHCADETTRQRATARLQAALLTIDEAAVSTIHGFCQRVLADFAFEGGQFFEHRIIADQSDIVVDAVQRFWRETFYTAPDFVAALAASRWKTPQGLLQKILPGLRPNIAIEPVLDRAGFTTGCDAALAAFRSLTQLWQQHRGDLEKMLTDNAALNKTSYKPAKIPLWFDTLESYFGVPSALTSLPKCIEYFTPEKLQKATKKGGTTPRHAFFDACADWMPMLAAFESQLLAYAAARVSALIQEIKQSQRYVYFDDLLTLLDATLQRPQSAELIARLREQFPVALIDEFQDTDAIQYRIFSTLYGSDPESTTRNSAMLLIGDPKQAIYAFRGADINTYVRARAAIDDDSRYTLGRNFRSSEPVVNAVNGLFSLQEDAFAQGGEIDFAAVGFNAANTARCEGIELERAGFELQWISGGIDKKGAPAPRRKGQASRMSAAYNAARIQRMLTQPHSLGGRTVTGDDIAVLVRDRIEARDIREALRAVGIDSVYLSKDRVFGTGEAVTMYRVLSACARPRRAALIRAVLGSDLIAMNALELRELDDEAWSLHAERFHHLHRLWVSEGFYAMWRQFLRDYPVAANVLALPDGERCLTNLQQLADLVANFEHSRQIDMTLRWFAREMQTDAGGAEDQLLRLESEANLVQVVTIHGSKGLEYPIVFLPFLFRVSDRKEAVAISFDNEQRQVMVDFGSAQFEQRQQRALRERHAEDIRLLYVALTRAKYHCVITTGDVELLQRTALHSVLFGDRNDAIADVDEWHKRLRNVLTGEIRSIENLPDAAFPERAVKGDEVSQQFAARELQHAIPVLHRMHSYSSLVKMALTDDAAHDYDGVATFDESFSAGVVEIRAAAPDIFEFPRGANAGTFWHEVLEKWREHEDEAAQLEWIDETLQRYGFDGARWCRVVQSHLQQILQTVLLAGSSTTLASLPASAILAEMEFFLPLSARDIADIWHYVALDRQQRGHALTPALSAQRLEGMLKGFIDAIACIDGKYYVIDYKTNYLGSTAADYTQAAMEKEILHHDYDLQYLIYCVALHRMLRRRLQGYDYARHFGGVLYLFVRGMGSEDFGVFRHLPSHAVIDGLEHAFTSAQMSAFDVDEAEVAT
jgi:exodeoxyribonuclease V beta subunit